MASGSPTIIERLVAAWNDRAIVLKALSFGLVGLINTAVDASVFFVTYTYVTSPSLDENLALIAANVMAWVVAVTCSFFLNAKTTFAAEAAGRIGWKTYVAFVASQVAGLVANTATLLLMARVFLLPVWAAKLCAILASFVVNFSLSNFVVFRAPRAKG